MNKSIVAIAVAGLVGAVGFTSVAAAAEGQLYGSIRAGVISSDDDGADSGNELDLGGTGTDGNVGGQGLYSRIGVKGEADLGNGASAGFQVERGVGATLSNRHHNVWIGGSWGKLTIGQQGNPFRSAAHWAQTWFLGGQYRFNDSGSRNEGIRYDLASGPFNLAIMATANDNQTDVPLASTAPSATTVVTTNTAEREYDDGVDSWIIAAGYDIGPVTLNVAHRTDNTDIQAAPLAVGATAAAGNNTAALLQAATNTTANALDKNTNDTSLEGTRSSDNTAIGLNGSFGPVGWYLAYQTSSDNANVLENDVDSIGGFVSFAASERDLLYFYHVSHDADRETRANVSNENVTLGTDPSETILGYSHSFGGGVTFIAEYLTFDKDRPTGVDGSDIDVLALALKVDF